MDFNFQIETFYDDIYKTVNYFPSRKQNEFHCNLTNHKYNIFRKSRGMGGSTTLAVESIIRLSHKPNYRIGYVPPNYTAGSLFMRRVHELAYSEPNLPSQVEKNFNKQVSFDNGSKLILVYGPDNLCGQNFDWLIFDDCFTNKDVKHILDISRRMDGERTLLATPLRGNDTFKRYYYGAITQQNEYFPTDYLWYDHPIYSQDMEWVRGNIRIPYDRCEITTIRLLEFGFHRESPTYNRYLKMFGHENDGDMDNFESYATSTY